jgi:hypothetical protein
MRLRVSNGGAALASFHIMFKIYMYLAPDMQHHDSYVCIVVHFSQPCPSLRMWLAPVNVINTLLIPSQETTHCTDSQSLEAVRRAQDREPQI